MITTGPSFYEYGKSEVSWIAVDNWVNVGKETLLTDPTTKGEWIVSISWWELKISHTQEMTQADIDTLIAAKADIMTMPSMKRNGNINPNASLWSHSYGHSLVQFNDGKRWEVILNNCNEQEKQKIINNLDVSRAVYADADAHNNFLDGIRIQTIGWLRYSHPDEWDLFIDEHVKSGNEEKNNMPGIIVHYAVEE